jgi:DNA helicase-2/ATP-dependent DNA helicase PcrA
MIEFGNLNESQRRAVTMPFDRPVKVTAGAGTGKTTVAAHRYLFALKNLPQAALPNLLCLTFSVRAAEVMKERILNALRACQRLQPQDEEDLWIYNFHSLAARILAENPFESEIGTDYRIADEAEQLLLRDEAIERILRGKSELPAPASLHAVDLSLLRQILREGFERYQEARQTSLLLSAHPGQGADLFATRLLELTRAHAHDFPEENTSELESEIATLFGIIAKEYEARKRLHRVLDYTDLIVRAIHFLRSNSRAAGRWKNKFRYIIVDEFQDTDRNQLELLRLLAQDSFTNVTVVGDDKQAIYEWRGARIENIREFPSEEVFLSENYRSCNQILEVANYSISQDEFFGKLGDKIALRNPRKGDGESPPVVLTVAPKKRRDIEANFVAAKIKALLEEGKTPGEIAVIIRSTTHSKIYEDAFRNCQIPYTALGGGFYEARELRDIIAYLRVIDDRTDSGALARVLESAPTYLSPAAIARIALTSRGSGRSRRERGKTLYQMIQQAKKGGSLDSDTDARVDDFLSFIDEISGLRALALPQLILEVLSRSRYTAQIEATEDLSTSRAMANIRKLLEIAAQFVNLHPYASLGEFINYIEHISMTSVREAEADPQVERDAVKLLTVHSVKGLEFEYVFHIDVRDREKEDYPQHIVDLPDDSEEGVGVAVRRLPGEEEVSRKYAAITQRRKVQERSEAEERRIFYVALTRAKERLFITTTRPDSQFFGEILARFRNHPGVEILEIPEQP